VRVRTPDGELRFPDLLLDEERPFDLNNEAYAKHVEGLKKLADELERAMLTKSRRARRFEVEAVLDMGLGARVYPSQEWASKNYKEESKLRWPGGEGVTRILAKLSRKDGTKQAIINDRKMGNRLRAIDTWHGEAGVGAIAVEPYGANSHHADAFRKNKNSAFELFKAVSEGRALSAEEGLFYLAICVRGGVFGG
jgi:CRISPR-associated protein Csy3